MAKGIVVDHKESGVRYAISEKNFNSKVHKRVRDLLPGETVVGFAPKRKDATEAPETVEVEGTQPIDPEPEAAKPARPTK